MGDIDEEMDKMSAGIVTSIGEEGVGFEKL